MIGDEKKWLLVLEDTREKPIKRKCFWIRDSYFSIVNDLVGQLNRAFINAGGYTDNSTVELPLAIESFSKICQRLNKFTKIYKNSDPISPEVESAFTGEKRVLNLEYLYSDYQEDMNYWFAIIGYGYGKDEHYVYLKVPVSISYNEVFRKTSYLCNIYYDEMTSRDLPLSLSSLTESITQLFQQFGGYKTADILDVFKLKYQDGYRKKSIPLEYIYEKKSIYCAEDDSHKHGMDIDKFNIYYKREFSIPYLKGNLDKEKLEVIDYPDKKQVNDFVVSLINQSLDVNIKAQTQSS